MDAVGLSEIFWCHITEDHNFHFDTSSQFMHYLSIKISIFKIWEQFIVSPYVVKKILQIGCL
jgi:hypothetical protein